MESASSKDERINDWVLFERPGWDDAAYLRWSRRLALDGRILCIPTQWKGRTVLRLAFVNPATEADHVLEVLAETTADPSGMPSC